MTLIAALAAALLGGCAPKRDTPQPEERERVSERREWSIAVHGGSGSMPKERLAGREQAFHDALGRAVTLGAEMLRGGASSLDTVEAVVRLLEDDPLFNAGKGAVFTHEGTIELDAAIMEGNALQSGAVAGIRTVKNPVTLARRVMERTPHVFLAGDGAEAFAREAGVDIVDPSYFRTQERWDELQRELRRESTNAVALPTPEMGTVGAVALDRAGQPRRRDLDRRSHQQAVRAHRRRAGDRRRHLRQQPHLRGVGDRQGRGDDPPLRRRQRVGAHRARWAHVGAGGP